MSNIEDSMLSVLIDDKGFFDLNTFSEIVELFVYSREQKCASLNESPSIHYIMSSNLKDKATHDTNHAS